MVQVNFLDKRLNTFRLDFDPLFRHPVEYVDCVKPLFVGTTPTKNDDAIVLRIITHGAV